MHTEPVRIWLGGLAVLVNLGMVAAVALGLLHLDAGQIASVVAFVSAACVLASETLRARNDSPLTVARKVYDARTSS